MITIKDAVGNSTTRSVGHSSGTVSNERRTIASQRRVSDVLAAQLVIITRLDVSTMVLVIVCQTVVHEHLTLPIHRTQLTLDCAQRVQTSTKVSNLNRKWSRIRIQIYRLICRIAPKMLCIHHLVGVCHFGKWRKNWPVTVWEMLINLSKFIFRNGDGSGKVTRNPYLGPDHHLKFPDTDSRSLLTKLKQHINTPLL